MKRDTPMYSLRISLERMRPSSISVGSIYTNTISCWPSNGSKTRTLTTNQASKKCKMSSRQLIRNELVKWALTNHASSHPSQELQVHLWCRSLIQVPLTRTPLSVPCLRCKVSTRQDSTRTRSFLVALIATARMVTQLATYHNLNKTLKESKAMLQI